MTYFSRGSHTWYATEQGVIDTSAGPRRALHEGFGCEATTPPEFELHGETSAKVCASMCEGYTRLCIYLALARLTRSRYCGRTGVCLCQTGGGSLRPSCLSMWDRSPLQAPYVQLYLARGTSACFHNRGVSRTQEWGRFSARNWEAIRRRSH